MKRVPPPQVDVQMGEPFYEEIQAYQKRFMSLLDAEQAEDEAVLKERLSSWSIDRLRAEGYALTGLSAFWMDATQFGRPVASFLLGPGISLPDHRFENGRQVLISRLDPLREPPLSGSVLGRTATQLRVSFAERFELDDGTWRLDVGRSNFIYDRMRTAIAHMNHAPALLESAPAAAADREVILQGTHLRDVLLRSFAQPTHRALQEADDVRYPEHDALDHAGDAGGSQGGAFAEDMRVHSWARRYRELVPVRVEGDPELTGLNSTQTRAIAMMLAEPVSLVQGPPGTGKTKTIIEAVKLLKVHFEVPHPLLVCTYTNVAVDNLVEGLASAGLSPLRVGFGGKVKPSLFPHTLDAKLEAHALAPEVEKLAAEEEKLGKKLEDLAARMSAAAGKPGLGARLERMQGAHTGLERQVQKVRSKMYAMRQQMLRDVVASADVICTTCITAACAALNVVDFPVVFLDEASMSTEPASLVPIMKGSRHIALIGDHKQLPPVITSREAQAQGLGISLFERLTEEGHVPSIMLDIQYRMHPNISSFPRSEFYNYMLIDGTVDGAGNVPAVLHPPQSRHLEINTEGDRPSVVFLDHAGSESMKDRSRVNWNEASIVCSVVEDLLLNNPDLRGSDIGIIAPYVAQVSLLMRLLNTDARQRARAKAVLGEHRAMQLGAVEVKTVDGFEGREKEVIIFSTVRNNAGGHIGFLADRRRLNVGLTRARRGLFVVGSLSTLRHGVVSGAGEKARVGKGAHAWRRYAEFLTKHGLVVQLSGAALQQTLYGNLEGVADVQAFLGASTATRTRGRGLAPLSTRMLDL
ncbi:hypothetical protein PLICRDRAFT_40479 [Plicaturopsis crispa FD-325 SS-3]|nr:hypothetical protein PLICRDRAFT_40479 [Plicaturopsis crispa FD-325 SS-3]